jgi:hypothetical protein
MSRVVPNLQTPQMYNQAHHGHAHHAHHHAPQGPMAGSGQIMMEVQQTADGGWGLVPYIPPGTQPQPGMGQTVNPQPSWAGLALLLGGTGLALWWAYKRWWKTDGTSSARERSPEREDIREGTRSPGYRGHGTGRYDRSYGRDAWQTRRGKEDAHEGARPDERRSRRSKARLLAEYKRLLESQGL